MPDGSRPPPRHLPHHAPPAEASRRAVADLLARRAPVHASHPLLGRTVVQAGRLAPSVAVPGSDFDAIKARKVIGVPSIGLDAPNVGADASASDPPERRPLQGKHPLNRGQRVALAPARVSLNLDAFTQTPIPGIANSIVETGPNVGSDAETIVVQLGLAYADADPTTGQPSQNCGQVRLIQALLQWGIGGAQYQAICDWENGLQFALPASYVRVGAQYTAFAAPGSEAPVSAILQASLSYGVPLMPRSGNARLTTSSKYGMFGIGGWAAPVLVPVPAFAQSFGMTVNPHAFTDTTLLEVNVLDTAGGRIAGYSYNTRSNSGQQIESAYPLPNGAAFLQFIEHSTPANSDDLTVVFGLSF